MADIRKTITGLECCKTENCSECPYEDTSAPVGKFGTDELVACQPVLYADALSLLKAQENPDRVNVVRCRDCVEWEAPTKAEQSDGETIGHCRCRFGTCYGQQTDMNWFCADGEREE